MSIHLGTRNTGGRQQNPRGFARARTLLSSGSLANPRSTTADLLWLLLRWAAVASLGTLSLAQMPAPSASPKVTTATCGKPVCIWNAFGPNTYERQTGEPQTVSSSFSVLNPNAQFTLHVDNSGVSSALIAINGTPVLGPSDFDANVTGLDRAIALSSANIVAVELRSAPGTSLALTIIGVDNDPPGIIETATPGPNLLGWNNTNVNISFTCSDATSGVVLCPSPLTLTTEGLNQLVAGTAFDLAGNSATASVQISIDKTPPAILASQAPAANSFGWNNTTVTVSFACNDNLSGVQFCSSPVLVSSQGQNQAIAGKAIDFAGNSAAANTAVSIDLTPPTIIAMASPAPNAAGWNNTLVTVTFSCADDLSGVASCSQGQTVSADGANQSISGTGSDKAGNSASATATVNLDQTPPIINVSSPADNSASNTPTLAVTGTASDALSGLASVACNGSAAVLQNGSFTCSVTLTQGANAINIEAIDVAGNSTTATRTVDFTSAGPLAFLSAPPQLGIVGKPLQYQVMAQSPNPNALVFSLTQAPAGMTIDSGSGLMTWTPTGNQTGDQPVTVAAKDSTGEIFQSFSISVMGSRVAASALILAASGGVITVADPTSRINGLSLSIPAAALPSDTTITISELSGTSSLAGTHRFLLKGFAIDPDGISLALPATVTVPYSLSEFDTSEGIPLEDFLGAYFVDASGNLQGQETFIVDTTNHVVTGAIPHFSAWEIANLARLCPPPTTLSVCPNSYSPATASNQLPVIMVHGLVCPWLCLLDLGPGFGDESTWGNLRFMLGNVDHGGGDRVDAWRFDYDAAHTAFEVSAGNLAIAIDLVKLRAGASLVNLVAHSFGGILVRTYLQDKANFGNPHFSHRLYSNRNDVNRVMTLGTPHSGIGGDFSMGYANLCADAAQIHPRTWITCFDTSTGAGGGRLVHDLNSSRVPDLQSTTPPQYDIIEGQILDTDIFPSVSLVRNDGFITAQGAAIPCTGGCPSGPFLLVEPIAKTTLDPFGLCHSGALFGRAINSRGCGSDNDRNIAMAAVNFPQHPLWSKICLFLDSNSDACTPRLTVTLSDPHGGKVFTIFEQPSIDCGQSCTASYPEGTRVTLRVVPNAAAFSFAGWSGDCSGKGNAQLLMDADKSCTAIFSPLPIQISSVTCTVAPSGFGFLIATVTAQGSVTDPGVGDLFTLNPFGGLNCGQWSQLAINACIHNPGQPDSTNWSMGEQLLFPQEVFSSLTATLVQAGTVGPSASALVNCQ